MRDQLLMRRGRVSESTPPVCQPALISPPPPRVPGAVRVHHELSGDPRMRRSELENLASKAAPWSVEHHLSALPVLLPTGEAPQLALGPAEVASGIQDNDCWLGLFHLERQHPYRRLLDECVESWAASFASEGGMKSTTANVFLASPHSVTPAHIDCYHNLLLQIEGTKEVVVGMFDSPEQEAAEVNRHFSPEHSNFASLPTRQTSWLIGPGEGLRRMGLRPAPAGNIDAIDAAKAAVVKAVRRSRQSGVVRVARRTVATRRRARPPAERSHAASDVDGAHDRGDQP